MEKYRDYSKNDKDIRKGKSVNGIYYVSTASVFDDAIYSGKYIRRGKKIYKNPYYI